MIEVNHKDFPEKEPLNSTKASQNDQPGSTKVGLSRKSKLLILAAVIALLIASISITLSLLITRSLHSEENTSQEEKIFSNSTHSKSLAKPRNSLLDTYLHDFKWTFLSSHIISKDIFDLEKTAFKNDIFLFSGKSYFRLSKLTDLNVEEANIILDEAQKNYGSIYPLSYFYHYTNNDFDQFCNLSNSKNKGERFRVHHINFDNTGTLKWIKSCNGIQEPDNGPLLLGTLSSNQEQVNMDELINRTLSSKSLQPTIITDTFQLEISRVMEDLRERLIQLLPGRNVTCLTYTNFLNLIGKERNSYEADYSDKTDIIKVINNILKLNATDSVIKMELLILDLDYSWNGMTKPYQALQYLVESFKSVRLWVLTRPDGKNHLENMLSTLSYELKFLNETEQVELIVNKWGPLIISENSGKLFQFAKNKLSNISNSVPPKISYLLGPLFLPIMIAEVYEDEAIANLQDNHLALNYSTENVFLPNLFLKFINQVLQSGSEYNRTNLFQPHYQLSLEYAFPQLSKILNFSANDFDMDAVIKAGLVEKSSFLKTPRFFHELIPDYFIVSYFMKAVKSGNSEKSLSHLFFNITDTIATSYSQRFWNYGMCYFLNNAIAEANAIHNSSYINYFNNLLSKPTKELRLIAHVSIISNLLQIFHLIHKVIELRDPSFSLFDMRTLRSAVSYADFDFVKLALSKYEEQLGPVPTEMQGYILLIALSRGDPQIFSYLLLEKNFTSPNFPSLLIPLLSNTRGKSDAEIDGILGIINALFQKFPTIFADYSEMYIQSALLTFGQVHIRILLHLLSLGAEADLSDAFQDSHRNWFSSDTVLHWDKERRPYTPDEFHQLISHISQAQLEQIVKIKAYGWDTILLRLIKHIDPINNTLEILSNSGANFNDADFYFKPVLAVAIRRGRSLKTIQDLIKFGSSATNDLLHEAANVGNIEILEYLLRDEFQLDINAIGKDGDTPLMKGVGWGVEMIQLLFSHGASIEISNWAGELLFTALDYLDEDESDAIELIACKMFLENWSPSHNREGRILAEIFLKYEMIRDSSCFLDIMKVAIKFRGEEGNILHSSMALKDLNLIKFLVKNRADIDFQDEAGHTPLHVLYIKSCGLDWDGLLEITGFLIDSGADVNIRDEKKDMFIHSMFGYKYHCPNKYYEATPENFDNLVELLDKKGKLDLLGEIGGRMDLTAFEEMLRKIQLHEGTLLKISKTINFGPRGGYILGISIIKERSLSYIKKLIEFGADWKKLAMNGWNVLQIAAASSNLEVINLLLELGGIDVNQKDEEGITALHSASGWNRKERTRLNMIPIFKLLLEHGGNINVKNKYERTPLHDVASNWREEWFGSNPILNFLIDKGADVYMKDDKNRTFLHEFFQSTHPYSFAEGFSPNGVKVLETEQLVDLLVLRGKIDLFNMNGGEDRATPFQLAVRSLELIDNTLETLKANKVDFNAKNKDGDSVLKYAVVGERSKRLVMKLVELGAEWEDWIGKKEEYAYEYEMESKE